MSQYTVTVGNIGIVYDGTNEAVALREYYEYVELSKSGYGRAGDEDVVLIDDAEVREEHIAANFMAPIVALRRLLELLNDNIYTGDREYQQRVSEVWELRQRFDNEWVPKLEKTYRESRNASKSTS